MMRTWIASVGCAAAACCATAGEDKPEPRLLENAIEVVPERIARVRMEHGEVVRVGDWMEYNGGVASGPSDDLVFDCIRLTGPCSGGGLWFLGTGYCNGFVTNDMTLHPDTMLSVGLGRVDLAWFWGCGEGSSEDCEISVFTQESVPCEPDSFDYSGWMLDFGELECNPGAFYYSEADLMGDTWTAPTEGVGSYLFLYTTDDGNALATCPQPMLWATGDARGDPDAPGTQGPEQLDDDDPMNGTHTLPTECADYSLGECPDPLGAAVGLWGDLGGCDCSFADCDENGAFDTRDFTCFLNLWTAQDGDADCDGNNLVDTRDFTCFLNLWVSCQDC